jgi:hypothetical protein
MAAHNPRIKTSRLRKLVDTLKAESDVGYVKNRLIAKVGATDPEEADKQEAKYIAALLARIAEAAL